jgi:ornithine cyclodeaminase
VKEEAFIGEGYSVLLLKKEDMQKVYTMAEAIEAVKHAFRLFSEGKSVVPLRTGIDVDKYEGRALFMSAYVEETESLGLKIVSVFPNNVKVGKPAVPATMVYMDCKTGEVSAVMDGTYLTQVRTGAASGAATDLLARKDASVGAIFGAGGQSWAQIEAMLTVRELSEVRIFDVSFERSQEAARQQAKKWQDRGVRFVAARTAEEAVDGADVITTVTTAKKPVFPADAVKKGAHVNGVGSFTPVMQEIPSEIYARAGKVFVDSKDAVLAESGDLIIPMNQGLFDESVISGELGQLVAGRIEGRTSDEEITVFKTVGIGVQDVVTAGEIYNRAVASGAGTEIPF